jgi:hypothetical protein
MGRKAHLPRGAEWRFPPIDRRTRPCQPGAMVKLTILCHPLTPVAPAELGGWLSKQADRLRSSASLIVHLSQLTQGRKIAAGWYRMHRPMCPERPWTWTYKPRGTLRDGSTPITRGRGAEKSLVQIQSSPITSHQLRKQRARLQRPRRPPASRSAAGSAASHGSTWLPRTGGVCTTSPPASDQIRARGNSAPCRGSPWSLRVTERELGILGRIRAGRTPFLDAIGDRASPGIGRGRLLVDDQPWRRAKVEHLLGTHQVDVLFVEQLEAWEERRARVGP